MPYYGFLVLCLKSFYLSCIGFEGCIAGEPHEPYKILGAFFNDCLEKGVYSVYRVIEIFISYDYSVLIITPSLHIYNPSQSTYLLLVQKVCIPVGSAVGVL